MPNKNTKEEWGETRRSAGVLRINNFHCSAHGYIKPVPDCPKCKINSHQDATRELKKRVEEMYNKDKPGEFGDGYKFAIQEVLDLLSGEEQK